MDNTVVLSQLTALHAKIDQIAREQEALSAKQANVLNKAQASFEDQMMDARATGMLCRVPLCLMLFT
jgi:acyl-CoA synthetase (NDP forming)